MPNNYTDTKVNDMIFNVLDSDTYNTLSSGGSLSANELYFITDDEKIDIEYIVGTQESATNVWTGNSRDKSLSIGKIIAYKLPVAGTSDAATLTLTMSGGAIVGPIQIKRKGTGNTTTHYSAGEVIFMAYDGTYWQTNSYYDSNSNDTTTTYARYTYAQIAPTTALYRYQILLPSFSDTTRAIPLNTTSNTTGTSKATITTESFNPFDQIYYYSTTSTVAAGTNIGVSYLWYAYCRVNLQYSFNTASTLTAHKDVYLVAKMQSDGSAKLRNPGATGSDASAQATGANAGPITQTLPSTDDGYIYIKLGRACDTYRIDLTITHPIYVYKNGALRTLSGYAEYAALAAEATHAINASTADLATEATHATSATSADSATTATNATNASNVPWSGVSGKPSSFTPSSHTHGNIQNGGTLQTNDVAIASGDKLVITDSSDGNKVARTSTTFGTSTTTFLNNKGEWATPAGNYTLPKATTSTLGGVIVGSGISVNSSTGAISVSAANLGLSNALHFIGKATVVITDGSTTDPVISGYDFDNAKQAGDVIIDKDNSDEYVWTAEGKWERLGPDGSYALSSHTHGNITNAGELGTANRMVVTDSNKKITILDATVSSPSASGTATAFISSVSQSSQGKISATKANLPTASTTAAGIVQLGTTSGTAAEGNHTHTTTIATSTGTNQITLAHGGKYSITAGGTSYVFTMPASGNTDRYVNSASFADDTTNTAASPVKMTLTRAGSDTATVTANIPKVSSSSAGVAPKGAAVTSQSQSTKFLREDGTWAAPSYTTNSNTTYTFENGTNGSFTVTPSGGSAQTVSIGKPATAGTADSANAVAWANVSGKPSTFTPAAHTHYELATIGDQRSTATTPNTYSNRFIFQGLKTNTAIGSPSTDTYSYLIGLRGWSDQSGGKSHELAFNNTGIYWRMGSTTEWDSWYRIYTTANKPTASDVGLGNVTNHQQVHDVAWDSGNKKITRSKNGTAGDVVQFVAGSNVTLTAESGKLTIASSYTNTNYYHTTGSWNGLTYTATANGGAGALAFTIPTGTTSTTVALGNHTHTTTIATSTATNQITLSHGGKYAITAGGTSYVFTMPSDNNTATAADDILDGSNSGTQITYAPYTTQQSKLSFDTSTTAPSRTDRLNLNGYLYATKLYSGGNEVLTSHQSVTNNNVSVSWNTETTIATIGGTAIKIKIPANPNTDTDISTLTLASDTGTSGVVALAHGGKYKLTAGTKSVIFTLPSDNNTNYYHTTGSWSGLTYTATANGGAGALAFTIPTGTTSTTVALGNHTHATSIATSTGTNQITLAHGGKYAITAGGTSYIFTMPSDNNTDTLVTQTATDTTNANYELLFSATGDNTTRTETARKTSNLIFNPSTGLLTTKNISLTGDLTLTGDAYLNSQTYAEDITTNTLLVNGNANFVAIPTAPTAADGTNNTQLATTAFVYNAFKSNDAMVFKGVVNSNSDLPATHYQGWTYKIGTAGTYAGQTCEIGDTIYCVTDGTAANNAHWVVIQNNVDGAVYRGSNAFTDANIIIADSTAGKVKSSGKTITTTAPGSSAADTTIPTSKAVWSAITGASGYGKTGTVTSVATGAGLTGGTITTSGTIKANLNSETSLGTIGTTSKLYAVGVDSNGKLAVNVPWTDTNTDISTLTLASDTGTSSITLAYGSKYKLTAGSKTVIFTMPSSDNTNTTYTFANGTNCFYVTPSGGSQQTVTVTPSISNNITGSGTNGYLAKFNGTNTITNGPALGSGTTTYLRNDGTWQTPTDTKNTAGSTDTSSKIFLIGATSQAANPQTYSDNQVYATNGQLDANKVRIAEAVSLIYDSSLETLNFVFA